MSVNWFLKRVSMLGVNAKKKIEKCLGGAVNSRKELMEKFKGGGSKARLKVVKQVGAGVLSVLLLCGFTGCVDEKDDIVTTNPGITTVSRTELTSEIIPSTAVTTEPEPTTGEPTTGTTKTDDPTTGTTTPVEPTTGTTTPNEPTTGTTTPNEPTTETTAPSEPTTGTTNPSEPTTGTTAPSEPTTGTTAPSEPTTGTTAPSEPTTGTTTPSEPDEPEIVEDLPGDEDGYAYPATFKNLVEEMIRARGVFNGERYADELKQANAEVVFVERGTSSKSESYTPIVIYTRHSLDNGKTYYGRFCFEVDEFDYLCIGVPKYYDSYSSYIAAVEKALKNNTGLVSAKLSELEDQTDSINAGLTENFAKFVDESFVDVEINFFRDVLPKNESAYREISGFGYDKDGKSYSFVIDIYTGDYYPTTLGLMKDINDGTVSRKDMGKVESDIRAIDSVFQKETENQNQ